MATPTSHPQPHPRSSPSKILPSAANHLTPTSAAAAAASSPPAPPSSHSANHRTISSPAAKRVQQNGYHNPNTNNNHARGPSSSNAGTPMAHTGTNNSSQKGEGGGRARTATNASTMGFGSGVSVDSPAVTAAAAMLAAAEGSGLGLTPGGSGLTPLGIPNGSVRGGGSSVGGLVGMAPLEQEEERRRRVEVIAGLIGGRWGFVGQEGVERCARGLGLECLWEEGMEGRGRRVLSIAGHGLLIEVGFEGDGVVDVGLTFPGCVEGEGEHVHRGSRILEKGLTRRESDGEGYVRLDGFAGNLERLARMDQMGGEGVNCFDAVDGIYSSLDRIYRWELEHVKSHQRQISAPEVVCLHGGRPVRNIGESIGVACQYRIDQQHSLDEHNIFQSSDADASSKTESKNDVSIWSAVIECEACPADLFPPIRTSTNWVSLAVEKSPTQELDELHISSTNIDWLEVPTPLGSPNGHSNDAMITNGDVKTPPDIRFVARLDPPLVLPLQIALQIYETLGAPISQDTILPTTYDALLFADIDATPTTTLSPSSPRTFERSVTSYDTNTEDPRKTTHKSTLYTQPQDFGRVVTDLPFKHPMQVIALLPTLRQWALVASILRRSFVPPLPQEPESTTTSPTTNPPPNPNPKPAPPIYQSIEDELAAFIAGPSPSSITNTQSSNQPPIRTVDISFTASTAPLPPRFVVNFANSRFGGKLASVGFSVGLNGVVEGVDVDDGGPPGGNAVLGDGAIKSGAVTGVGGQDVVMGEGGGDEVCAVKEKLKLREKVKKVLEIGEDLGVVVEWVCGGS